MYVKSVRDNRSSMARVNCAQKLNIQCGAQYSYCTGGRGGGSRRGENRDKLESTEERDAF